MKCASILPRRQIDIAGLALLLLVLIAAVINVPWALTFMRSRVTKRQVSTVVVEAPANPPAWPAATPHANRWPAPEDWVEGRAFGCRILNVFGGKRDDGSAQFQMQAQLLGWPLPVIEDKAMWWDWNDPNLAGPEPDPAPTLRLQGLVLNPLILGGGVWAVLVLPWILVIVATRHRRYRKHRCMDCGYPVGVSDVCTECGGAVVRRPG